MNFFRRLFTYLSNTRFPTGYLSAIIFSIIRNHPLKKNSRAYGFLPFVKLFPSIFKQNHFLIDSSSFSHFIIAEEFIEHKIYDLNRVNFNLDVVFDCGAHIGLFSILANAYFPNTPVICFEPLPEKIKML